MKTENILKELRENGFRLTNIRKKLVDIFTNAKMPLSVQELTAKLEKSGITANKTTIYREIYFLQEQNIVAEIDFGDRRKRYESAHAEHHHHLVCLKCSSIQDITLSDHLKKEEQRIARQNNFKIIHHSLEFFGLCKQCRAS